MTEAIEQYESQIVLFSFMAYDLDRSLLSVRVGQKPHVTQRGDTLHLSSVPVDPDPTHFFTYLPQTSSYFFSVTHQIPRLKQPLGAREDSQFRSVKQALNEKIFLAVVQELCTRNIPCGFIIFHSDAAVLREDWRNAVAYVWPKDLLTHRESKLAIDDLICSKYAHPTTSHSKTTAREIRRFTQSLLP